MPQKKARQTPRCQTARPAGSGKHAHRKITASIHMVSDGLAFSPLINLPEPSPRLSDGNFSLQDIFFVVFGVLHLKHMFRILVKHPILPKH